MKEKGRREGREERVEGKRGGGKEGWGEGGKEGWGREERRDGGRKNE